MCFWRMIENELLLRLFGVTYWKTRKRVFYGFLKNLNGHTSASFVFIIDEDTLLWTVGTRYSWLPGLYYHWLLMPPRKHVTEHGQLQSATTMHKQKNTGKQILYKIVHSIWKQHQCKIIKCKLKKNYAFTFDDQASRSIYYTLKEGDRSNIVF